MGSSPEDDGSAVYDVPEEGVYNTPEAVYDTTGNNIVEERRTVSSSFVPASPKFDDRIYMDSNGNGAKKSGLSNIGE